MAELLLASAMQRKENRDQNYTLDYPDLLPQAQAPILQPPTFVG